MSMTYSLNELRGGGHWHQIILRIITARGAQYGAKYLMEFFSRIPKIPLICLLSSNITKRNHLHSKHQQFFSLHFLTMKSKWFSRSCCLSFLCLNVAFLDIKTRIFVSLPKSWLTSGSTYCQVKSYF